MKYSARNTIKAKVTSLIARGLHASVIRRAAGKINRVSLGGDIVFTGGVAKNPCMRTLLAEMLGRNILTPEDPQLVGALGAALLARTDHASRISPWR